MPDVIYVMYDIYDIYDIYYMYVDLTYTICSNVNIGVKRSVRTSGMQPTMLDILNNCFQGQKWNILFPKKFFVYFRISFVYFKWLEPARFSLKLLSLLDKSHLIGPNNHRKGGNNLFMTLCKFWATLINMEVAIAMQGPIMSQMSTKYHNTNHHNNDSVVCS